VADDYRKAARPDAPRGKVVKQAEPPEPGPRVVTGADPRKREIFSKQSAMAAMELETAKRTMALTARVLGTILTVLLLLWVVWSRAQYVELGYITTSSRGRLLLALELGAGPWLLVFGNGGAASPSDAPSWYRAGLALALALAFGLVLSGGLVGVAESLLALTI